MNPTKPAMINANDHLFGAVLAVLYVLVLLVTATDLAMSRDESFYVIAAEQEARWLDLLVHDSDQALTAESVDKHFRYNHEHPGLMKGLFALSWLAQEKLELFGQPTQAFRMPGILCAGLLLWLIYIFGARAVSRRVGVFAALAFALLPRVFYHAHLNCFDVPITLMLTWTVYCYWRSLENPLWSLWTGVAFGCALATKHNAWILPPILLIHWLWLVAGLHRPKDQKPALPFQRIPLWLLSMLLIGPGVFIGTWPWLWHTLLPRINAYMAFHMDHAYYNLAYLGTNYFRPPFPVAFPFVLTAFTVPATTLVLMVLGVGVRSRTLLPAALTRNLWPQGQLEPDARATDVLWFGCGLAPLLLIALPTTPIFGGTKHWFPAYPFLCLFAGCAATRVLGAVEGWAAERWRGPRTWLTASAVGVLLAPGLVETIHSHPFGLSHYTLLAGGVPGAADLGMNRQFWGFTTGSVADFLRKALPSGGSVFIHDTTGKAWQMLQRDGQIPNHIRTARHLSAADYALVHHEDHMAEVDFQIWTAFGTLQPAHVLHFDGVPIVSVYKNPRRIR